MVYLGCHTTLHLEVTLEADVARGVAVQHRLVIHISAHDDAGAMAGGSVGNDGGVHHAEVLHLSQPYAAEETEVAVAVGVDVEVLHHVCVAVEGAAVFGLHHALGVGVVAYGPPILAAEVDVGH